MRQIPKITEGNSLSDSVAVVLVFTTAIPGDSTNGGHQLE